MAIFVGINQGLIILIGHLSKIKNFCFRDTLKEGSVPLNFSAPSESKLS